MWLDNLIRIKKESGKTLEEISEISGIPRGTLNKIFAGQTKDPQLNTIKAIVHCLGFTLDDLDDDASSTKQNCSEIRLTREEKELIENYRKLTDKGRAAVDATLDRELAVLELLEIVNKQEQEKAKRNANPFTPEETEKLISGHKYTVEAAAYGGQSSTLHMTKDELDQLYKDLMKGRKD